MSNRFVNATTATACLLMFIASTSLMAQQLATTSDVVLRPVISEEFIPLQAISPVAADGFIGQAFLRKPPGNGPFPAVVLIHGGAPRWPTSQLREYAVHIHASRFLEAGFVVVAITRRDLDFGLPADQEQEPVLDAVAVIDYLIDLNYVDPQSIVVRGTSVGGYLALEVGANRKLAAIMVEEPFSMPFVGASLGPNNSDEPINTDKINLINSPMLLIRGDQTPNINDFNRDVFIPALQAENKSLRVITYPGELHSFAFYNSPERTLRPAVALEAFRQIELFFLENLPTQPQALDANFVQYEQIIRKID